MVHPSSRSVSSLSTDPRRALRYRYGSVLLQVINCFGRASLIARPARTRGGFHVIETVMVVVLRMITEHKYFAPSIRFNTPKGTTMSNRFLLNEIALLRACRYLAFLFITFLVGCPDSPTAPKEENPYGGGGSTNGQLMFWTDVNLSQIEVSVGGRVTGNITRYHTTVPSCGADGTVTITAPAGSLSYSARNVQGNTWSGTANVTANSCNTMRLTMADGGGSGGSGGGAGGSTGTGTNVTTCLSGIQKGTASQKNWTSLPAPFSYLQYKIYWSNNFSVYEIIWRNGSNQTLHFSYGAQAGSVPSTTGYRKTDFRSGQEETPPGITVRGLQDGGTACVRVDQVRAGANTGPYL